MVRLFIFLVSIFLLNACFGKKELTVRVKESGSNSLLFITQPNSEYVFFTDEITKTVSIEIEHNLDLNLSYQLECDASNNSIEFPDINDLLSGEIQEIDISVTNFVETETINCRVNVSDGNDAWNSDSFKLVINNFSSLGEVPAEFTFITQPNENDEYLFFTDDISKTVSIKVEHNLDLNLSYQLDCDVSNNTIESPAINNVLSGEMQSLDISVTNFALTETNSCRINVSDGTDSSTSASFNLVMYNFASTADHDNDGLTSKEETDGFDLIIEGVTQHITTDPTLADTDNDGFFDGYELFNSLTETQKNLVLSATHGMPSTNSQLGDTCFDNVDGLAKTPILMANQIVFDTNHHWDKSSAQVTTNPNANDTDSDGIGDGAEIAIQNRARCWQAFSPEVGQLLDKLHPSEETTLELGTIFYNTEDDLDYNSDGVGKTDLEEWFDGTSPNDVNDDLSYANAGDSATALNDNNFIYIPGGIDFDDDGNIDTGFWISKMRAKDAVDSSGTKLPDQEILTHTNTAKFLSFYFPVYNHDTQRFDKQLCLDSEETTLTGSFPSGCLQHIYRLDPYEEFVELVSFKDDTDSSLEQSPVYAQLRLLYSPITTNDDKKLTLLLPTMSEIQQVRMLISGNIDNWVGNVLYDGELKDNTFSHIIANNLLTRDFSVPKDYSSTIKNFVKSGMEIASALIVTNPTLGADSNSEAFIYHSPGTAPSTIVPYTDTSFPSSFPRWLMPIDNRNNENTIIDGLGGYQTLFDDNTAENAALVINASVIPNGLVQHGFWFYSSSEDFFSIFLDSPDVTEHFRGVYRENRESYFPIEGATIAFKTTPSDYIDITFAETVPEPVVIVELSHILLEDVTFELNILSSTTATQGDDFNLTQTEFTIPAGSTGHIIPLTIIDNPEIESDEVIALEIVNPTNVSLATADTSITLTITDDD